MFLCNEMAVVISISGELVNKIYSRGRTPSKLMLVGIWQLSLLILLHSALLLQYFAWLKQAAQAQGEGTVPGGIQKTCVSGA